MMELFSRFWDAYSLVFLSVWLGALVAWAFGGERSRLESVTFIALSFLLIWFAATRYETGYDWPAYQSFYAQLDQPSGKHEFEIGFIALAHLIKTFGLDFFAFQFVVTALQVFLTTVFIRKLFGGMALLGLAIYYTVPDLYLINSFSLMRQGLALACFLCGAAYLLQNRSFLAVLFLIAAVCFHTSSLVAGFILLLVWWVGVNYLLALAAVFLAVCAYLLGVNLPGAVIALLVQVPLFEKYAIYTNLDTASGSVLYKVLYTALFLVLFACSCYRRRSLKRAGMYDRQSKAVFDLGFWAVFLGFFFWAFPTVSSRLQGFFVFFLLYYLLQAFNVFSTAARLLLLSLVFVVSASVYAKFVLTKISLVYFPYQSVFSEDIERRSSGGERTDELYDELRWLWKGVLDD